MHESTKQTYRYRGFEDAEIERIDKRIKQLPNLLLITEPHDRRFSTAMQKLYAGQDITESIAEIRSQM